MTMDTAALMEGGIGKDAQASAMAVFAGESLPWPFVPEVLAPALRSRGEQVFGTRDPEVGLYSLEHYVSELAEPALGDYLLMGFDGHGLVSQALHYYLVCGPLALFVQRSHANPFADAEKSRRRIEGTLGLAEQIYRDVAQAESTGRLPTGKRLVIIDSDFSMSRWGWVSRGGAVALEADANSLLCALFSAKELLA